MRDKSHAGSPPIGVCFLEQNPISLDYLTRLLHGHGFEVVGEQEAYQRQNSSTAGRLVLAMDERLLAPGSRLSMRLLRIRFPQAKFLILAAVPPRGEQCQLLRGIDGFVLYADVKETLIPALRALTEGRLWLPPEVLEYLARLALQGDGKKLRLTLRETEVIRLIGEGLSNKEIGSNLGVGEKTVKFHASNVFAKLGVHDRNSAVEVARSLSASKPGRYPPAGSLCVKPQKASPDSTPTSHHSKGPEPGSRTQETGPKQAKILQASEASYFA
jgi:DNA-binding NarL/FixJ family response regulator